MALYFALMFNIYVFDPYMFYMNYFSAHCLKDFACCNRFNCISLLFRRSSFIAWKASPMMLTTEIMQATAHYTRLVLEAG